MDNLKPVMFTIMTICVMSIIVVTVYAENPTPYDEWDFNFIHVDVKQNPNNLRELIISPDVYYEGLEPLGSVNLELEITDPEGLSHQYSGTLSDITHQTSKDTTWFHPLLSEGTYTIQLIMKTTSVDHDHVFDSETIHYTVEPLGFERKLDYIVFETDEYIAYKISGNSSIQNYERLHVMFNLPDDHPIDRITLVNGEFDADIPVDIEEIYTESKNYDKMKVYLMKEQYLLPVANAQRILDYVMFTAVHENVCYSVDCQNIDVEPIESVEEEQEFPLWVFAFLEILGIIPLLMRRNKSKMNCDCAPINTINT